MSASSPLAAPSDSPAARVISNVPDALAAAYVQLSVVSHQVPSSIGPLVADPRVVQPWGEGHWAVTRGPVQGALGADLAFVATCTDAASKPPLATVLVMRTTGPTSAAELRDAITDLAQGHAALSRRLVRHLLRALEPAEAAPAPSAPANKRCMTERLTPREAEVLGLVSLGHSGQQVAGQLGLSHHTVNTHLRNCHSKLQARNRQQAIQKARATGQIR